MFTISETEKDLLVGQPRRVSDDFEQQMEQFLREQEDDDDQQLDDGELLSNDDVDQAVDHKDDFEHGRINDDDNVLTRNDDDLLLEMENCIN